MLPIGLIVGVLSWTAIAMAGIGVGFWAMRWFPEQPWFGRLVLAVFILVALMARQTKWGIPLMAVMLLLGSGMIPRKR